jgi:hypothetical protein
MNGGQELSYEFHGSQLWVDWPELAHGAQFPRLVRMTIDILIKLS